MREFRRTELIPQDKLITARLMDTTRLGRNVQVHQQNEEEDQPMPQFKGGNEEDHDQGQHQHFEHQFQQPEIGFQQSYWEQQQQDMLAREIQEVKKFQVNQTLMGNRKEPMEKLKQIMGLQQKEMTEIKKQLKEWTRHASSRDAYYYWAHQQANLNLTEIPIHQIPDLIQANAEKGRHIFHGALKSQLVAGSSSQAPPPQPADEPMADPKN
ncbi:hypothetical protein PIB30_099219 [Stylosanthes scabra]|uniref:Uncharacterized protein n=1 Tax=Stylosanthes scabra TaxID=79078 RepID=A0ABU6ZVE8_9FABA|nr:hypothetical protein [Stylosanthes scabra]